jgi:hypothetical protein
MSIEIGYDLPFAARVMVGNDDALRIRVRGGAGPTEEDLRRVWAHVEIFVHAALLGMGVGSSIAPRIAALPIDPDQHLFAALGSPTPDAVMFEAKGIVLEADYVVVLLHKMYALDQIVPLAEVVVELPRSVEDIGKSRLVRAPRSRLPGRAARLPFRFDDSAVASAGDHVTVSLAFSRPLEAAEVELLWQSLMVWTSQALQGGYLSPGKRESYFVNPRDRLLVLDNEVQWEIAEFEIDSHSLDAIVNFLVAFHTQFVPLHEVVFD